MVVMPLCHRLARFNANRVDPAKTFEGVPAPTLALLTLMPVYLYLLELVCDTVTGLDIGLPYFLWFPRCIAGANGFTQVVQNSLSLHVYCRSHDDHAHGKPVFIRGDAHGNESLYLVCMPIFAIRHRSRPKQTERQPLELNKILRFARVMGPVRGPRKAYLKWSL